MLEKDYCTSPTLNDCRFAHYRHHGSRGQGLRTATSENFLHRPQFPNVPVVPGNPGVLYLRHPRSRGVPYRGALSQQDVRTPRGNVPDYILATGSHLAGGGVLDSYHIGDSLPHISPTPFSFAGRSRALLGPSSSTVVRRVSSTTTFSEDDFQISYHKVQDSPAASWQDEEEEEGSSCVAGEKTPSVELPSLIRGTRKSQSEQLTRSAPNVSLTRPRSENLSISTEQPHNRHDNTGFTIIQSPAQRRPRLRMSSSRISGRDESPVEERCWPLGKQLPRSNLVNNIRSVEQQPETPTATPRVQHALRVNPSHNSQAIRGQPFSLTAHQFPFNSANNTKRQSSKSVPVRNTPLEDLPLKIQNENLVLSANASSRVGFIPPSPDTVDRSNYDARTSPSPRVVMDREDVSRMSRKTDDVAIVDTMVNSSDAEITNIESSIPAGDNFSHKAVQVHIRVLDKRLIACSVLCCFLAVALIAVVLFAILDR
ncbi:unnamed protein product [Ixodes persulcatus]